MAILTKALCETYRNVYGLASLRNPQGAPTGVTERAMEDALDTIDELRQLVADMQDKCQGCGIYRSCAGMSPLYTRIQQAQE